MKWTFKGLDKYISQLEKISNTSEECIGRAVHDGAGIVADAVRAGIGSIPVTDWYGTPSHPAHGITAEQKAGLESGFGISHMKDENGYLNVKLGFDGYNNVSTKTYPNGQPNSLIARSVNSGTSFRQKFPFVDNATRQTKSACEKKMEEVLDNEIKRITGGN